MTIHELVASLEPEINAVRQQIHENPELGLKEYNTSALIEKELREKLMLTESSTSVKPDFWWK